MARITSQFATNWKVLVRISGSFIRFKVFISLSGKMRLPKLYHYSEEHMTPLCKEVTSLLGKGAV